MPAVLIAFKRMLNIFGYRAVDVFVNAFLACKRGLFVIMHTAEAHRAAVTYIFVDPLNAENFFKFSVRNKRSVQKNTAVI